MQGKEYLLLQFLPWVSSLVALKFRHFIQFLVNFCIYSKGRVQFLSFGYPGPLAPFVEKSILSFLWIGYFGLLNFHMNHRIVFIVQLLSAISGLKAPLPFTISWNLLKLVSIKSVMPSNHLILCHPLLLLPSIFSSIRVFSSESALCIMWPKYWNLSFSSLSSEYSGLIAFRIDWFDFLAVQGSFKSLFQHHNSKEKILWCIALVMVQRSHLYVATGKTVALIIWSFVGKAMVLLLTMLSMFIIALLTKSLLVKKHPIGIL